MNSEKMIEKMVSKMGEWAIENRMCFNSKHAESLAHFLLEKGDSEGSVVLTKVEYENLKALPEKVHNEMDERMKEELAIEKRMGEKKAEQARKETAREILNVIGKLDDDGLPMKCYVWYQELCKKYEKFGVEVK